MRYLLANKARLKQLQLTAIKSMANMLIIGGLVVVFLAVWPQVKVELGYWWGRVTGVEYSLDQGVGEPYSPFSLLAKRGAPVKITPASRDFGLVIEKIGVSVPVVPNVPVSSRRDYNESLRYGAAHAAGTVFPGQPGNSYIFAHSSLNFWNLGEYATAFNLLHKLKIGDRVVVFYKGERYDYYVYETKIVPGFDLTPLTRTSDRPLLTLQTCYPPGTTFNRLIVSAELRNQPPY